jgi:hypothetical protein
VVESISGYDGRPCPRRYIYLGVYIKPGKKSPRCPAPLHHMEPQAAYPVVAAGAALVLLLISNSSFFGCIREGAPILFCGGHRGGFRRLNPTPPARQPTPLPYDAVHDYVGLPPTARPRSLRVPPQLTPVKEGVAPPQPPPPLPPPPPPPHNQQAAESADAGDTDDYGGRYGGRGRRRYHGHR